MARRPTPAATRLCVDMMQKYGREIKLHEAVGEKTPPRESVEVLAVCRKRVAVGTPVARRPPHGSVLEALPHTALTLGITINLESVSYGRHVDATLSAALCPQRVELACRFPLVDPLPSTDSAAAVRPALFARFAGTMGPSDSLKTCMSDVRRQTFSDRPPLPTTLRVVRGVGVSRVSRFSRMEFPRMLRVSDSAASVNNSR